MTWLFLKLELAGWRRDRRLWPLLVSALIGLVVVTVFATAGDISRREQQVLASVQGRTQWEDKGSANPHGMAHFGEYAFRPAGPLAKLDRGVQANLGKVVFLEGHQQGTPLHSDRDKAGSLARFDRLDAAFVLQIIVPLLLIFLGSTGLATDREAGRFKLSLVQGAPAQAVVGGRFFALWGLGLAMVAVVGFASVLTTMILGDSEHVSGGRAVAFVATYALFFAVVAAGIVSVSVWVRRAGSALVALLALWVLATALLPRVTASTAATVYPLPSQDAFQAELKAARAAGPDGHNPEDEELARIEKETLKKYGVETVDALPINFDGIRMQLDEEFGNRIWDRHYGELRQQIRRQRSLARVVAVANPFQAIDYVSMAVAGTDVDHDFAFQEQAEAHRRQMIEQLNNKHAYGGSKTGDWDWKASAEFLAGIDGFRFEEPAARAAISARMAEIASLLAWLTLFVFAMVRGAARLERGGLAC